MLATLLLVNAWGCSYAPTSYETPTALPAMGLAIDPVGDTSGAGIRQWDLTRLTVTQLRDTTVVVLDVTANIITALAGDSTSLHGFIDFDVDQDSTTGRQTAVDEYRRDGGSTGMRSEFQLVLGNVAPDGSMLVSDALSRAVGRVTPRVEGTRLTFRIPNTLLGSRAGLLSVSAVVGATGGASDFIPDRGHLSTHF